MANTKYCENIADRIVAAIKDGSTQKAAAKMNGITPESLSIWKSKYSEFGEAVERAQGCAQVLAEQSLLRIAARGNVTALMFYLRNRHPSEWQELQRREITVKETFEDWVAASGKPSTSAEQAEASHD